MLNQLKIKLKKPITIGIDIRDLKLATTGTKTYLTELLSALKKKGGQQHHPNFIQFNLATLLGT